MDDPDLIPTWRPPPNPAAHHVRPNSEVQRAIVLGAGDGPPHYRSHRPRRRPRGLPTPALFTLIAAVSFAVVYVALRSIDATLRARHASEGMPAQVRSGDGYATVASQDPLLRVERKRDLKHDVRKQPEAPAPTVPPAKAAKAAD